MTMRLILLGTGTSLPDPDRVQSGVLIEMDGRPILFDIGSGVLHRLTQLNIDLTRIQDIFLTHFHIDHSSDFLTLLQTVWLLHGTHEFRIYGPPPIDEWYRGLITTAYPYLQNKVKIAQQVLAESDSVHLGQCVITTCPTIHGSMPSRAYRIECADQSIVYSGDTAPCDVLIELARGTDILIHECNWLDGDHPPHAHTSPSELRAIVESCHPKKVILTHVAPEVVENGIEVVSTVKGHSDSEVILGEDLMQITL